MRQSGEVVDEEGRRREAEIERYGVLGREPGRDIQALAEITAQICDVPTAAINLITDSQQHQIATVGFEPSVCARADSLCAAVIDSGTVVVPDAALDPRFQDNPFVTGSIGRVRFYASAPLRNDAGVTIGRLCVFDDRPRELDERQTEALRLLGERVVDVLELRVRSCELEESLVELTRIRDELDRSNKRLSHFAGQVSHDLRTPLTAMMLSTEAVAQDPKVAGDDYLQGLLDGAMAAGHRMSSLIDEMLEYAQVGASVQMMDVDLGLVATAVVNDVASLLHEHGGQVFVDPLPTVTGDERQLYAVLLNLVSNGLKYHRPGIAPVVRLGAKRLDGRWRFEVVDNGLGVPSARRAEVFLPFVRGNETVKGSGIGLATAKRIVDAHGGAIGLLPGPGGVGTTAWFEIPD